MKIFVWQCAGDLTTSWHSGGGLVIVAESLEQARDMMKQNISGTKKDYDNPVWSRMKKKAPPLTEEPLFEASLRGKHEAQLMVFPNAGCC